MVLDKRKLNTKSLFAYATIIFIACATYFLRLAWQQCVNDALKYYEEISVIFTFIICGLIPFRVYIFSRKRIDLGTQKFRTFGPLVSYISDPLYDVALFYSALFMLHTVFQKGLSLDPLLVLLLVSATLLYDSVNDLLRTAREIFYGQSLQHIKTEQRASV
jgi:hypothetical protein